MCLHFLGMLFDRSGRQEDAEGHFRKAIFLAREIRDSDLEAVIWDAFGVSSIDHIMMPGPWDKTKTRFEKYREIAYELKDTKQQALANQILGTSSGVSDKGHVTAVNHSG